MFENSIEVLNEIGVSLEKSLPKYHRKLEKLKTKKENVGTRQHCLYTDYLKSIDGSKGNLIEDIFAVECLSYEMELFGDILRSIKFTKGGYTQERGVSRDSMITLSPLSRIINTRYDWHAWNESGGELSSVGKGWYGVCLGDKSVEFYRFNKLSRLIVELCSSPILLEDIVSKVYGKLEDHVNKSRVGDIVYEQCRKLGNVGVLCHVRNDKLNVVMNNMNRYLFESHDGVQAEIKLSNNLGVLVRSAGFAKSCIQYIVSQYGDRVENLYRCLELDSCMYSIFKVLESSSINNLYSREYDEYWRSSNVVERALKAEKVVNIIGRVCDTRTLWIPPYVVSS